MPRYQYAGPGPVPDPESGEIVHPGDVCEYPEEPVWGPWKLLDPPAGAKPPPAAPAAPALPSAGEPAKPEGK